MRSEVQVLSFMIAVLIALVIALVVAVVPAVAQTPSELFERGVYNEETVGDLDRAIEIYRKITDDATAPRPQIAEALFRIGMCQLKKNDEDAATATFERIIAEYTNHERFVSLARANMPAGAEDLEFLEAPWLDGEVQRMSLRLVSGVEIGTLLLTVDPVEVDGVEAWRFRTRRRIYSDADNQAFSQVLARRDNLAPLTSTMKHSLLGHFEATYGTDKLTVTTLGADTTREEPIEGTVFDNEQGFYLFRQLPLEPGFKAKMRFLSTVVGPAESIDVEVSDFETLNVGAGEFEAYPVTFGSIPQTFWFSTDPNHYLVKLEAGGIVGTLEEVYRRNPKDGIVHVDDKAGFTVTAPPGWLQAPFDDRGTPKMIMLDPAADARSVIRLHPISGTCSSHAAATRKLGDCEQMYAGWKLREGTWYEREINRRSAVSFIGDWREGERDIAQYWTIVEARDYCVEFDFMVPVDQLEDMRADLDAIVASYDGPRKEEKPITREGPPAERVKAVITDFHRAAAEADLDRYVEHLSPDLVFLGTDRTERFDLDTLTTTAESYFSRGIGWVAEPTEQNVFVSEDGTMAWFDERLESVNLGEMRVSGVLRLEDDRWRIVQYNVAFPVPNNLIPDLVQRIAEVDETVNERPTKLEDAPALDVDDPGYEVKLALREFHRAASLADAKRYFDHLAPDVVYFGTDRAERFTLDKIRAFVEPYLAAGSGWTSVPFDQRVSFSEDGRIAWFEQGLGRERIGEMRATGVMRKDEGQWKIVHYNLALPVPNELAEDLVAKIRSFYGPG